MMETCLNRLEKARAGDRQAWSEVIDIYKPILDAVFREREIPMHEWPTLRNEVWVRLFRWLPRFRRDGTGAFRKTLRTFGRRVAAGYFEEVANDPTQQVDDETWGVVDGDAAKDSFEDMEALVDTRDLVNALLHSLGQEVSPASLAVLQLTYWEGLNATEIADRLKMKPEAVRQARSRALAELRTMLLEYHGFEPSDLTRPKSKSQSPIKPK